MPCPPCVGVPLPPIIIHNPPPQTRPPPKPPTSQLLPALEGLGYACPPLFNPADFVLELASAKVIKGQEAG